MWLLLLPFALVNVAFFMAVVPLGLNPKVSPVQAIPAGRGGKPWRGTRRTLEAALRLLGLALTAWSVLAAVCVAMDLVGWQHVRRSAAATVGWLQFLHWGWLDHPERQYALTAAIPLVLVIVLWLLARHTWAVQERTRVRAATPTTALTPLEDRRMWNGERPVARLRAVHLSVALGIVAAALMMPLWQRGGTAAGNLLSDVWHRPDGPVVTVLSAAIAAFLATAMVLACRPSMTDREQPQEEGQKPPPVGYMRRMHWLGLPLIAAAAAVVLRGRYWDSAWPQGTTGPLPGLAASLDILFAVTALLLLTVTVLALVLRLMAMRGARPEVTGPDRVDEPAQTTAPPAAATPGHPVATQPVWCGLAPAVLATVGSLLMAGGAAGLALAAARLLGQPVTVLETGGAGGLIVPTAFEWAAAAASIPGSDPGSGPTRSSYPRDRSFRHSWPRTYSEGSANRDCRSAPPRCWQVPQALAHPAPELSTATGRYCASNLALRPRQFGRFRANSSL